MSDRKENINFNLYEDIKKRTNGEIYLGVVGPVRTGKSTFVNIYLKQTGFDYLKINASNDIKIIEKKLRDEKILKLFMENRKEFNPFNILLTTNSVFNPSIQYFWKIKSKLIA